MASAVLVVVAAGLVVALFVVASRGRRLLAHRRLRDSDHFASQIISNAGEGIVVYDCDFRYVVWNRFMEELTGRSAEEELGRKATEILPHLVELDVVPLLEKALAGQTVFSPDTPYRVPENGKNGWVSAVYRPCYDAGGAVIGVIGLIRDITQRKAAEQQIEYQAYHDSLTGLANRRMFQEHLTIALAMSQRRRRFVAVLFLDLDHFKLVNDTLGHSRGDALLRQIASRLRGCVREGDTVARVGGDEFTIVLQDLEKKDDAALVASKLLQVVAEPVDIEGQRLYVTTSIGISMSPGDGEDAETLLKNADNAMYRAKAEGRNTYELSTIEQSKLVQDRMMLESGL